MSKPSARLLVICLTLGALLGLGLALAAPKSPAVKAPTRAASRALDCAQLEKTLRACALHVVAATDPEATGRLRKMRPALRKAVVTTFTDEMLAKVVAPCQRRRGILPGATPIAACLPRSGGTDTAACQRFASCVKAAFAKLPAAPGR